MAAFVQGVRLVILGVGVWAIVGTTLSIWNPDSRSGQASQAADETSNTVQAQQLLSPGSANSFATLLEPRQEISELATRITPVTQEFADLIPGVFVMDLDSGDYYSLNGDAGFSAASMIKVPVLVAFFQDVDAGKIRLDEMLTLQQEDLAGESGEMQFDGVGTQYTALETAIAMIAISDNTATNILIRRLGGMQALNQRFQEWGLQQTVLHNLLPDIEGTNMTSPRELSMLIARVGEGELVSMKSRDRLLDIMQTTVTNSMLPASLSPGATISHKTGDIGSVTGDSGLVDLPSGKRYAITVMVKRPHSDARGYELVFRIGEVINRYFGERSSTSTASTSPPTPGTPLPADAGNPSPATAQPAAQ
ncbi:MAG: serine hydrolase [Elainellaceae cyanobacterium]